MLYKIRLDVIEEDLNKWCVGKKIYKYWWFLMFIVFVFLFCSIFFYGVFYNKVVFVVLGFMFVFFLFWFFIGKEDILDIWED